MTSIAPARVGLSGWQYKHWRGDFYPSELPATRWFERDAAHFDTVEINTTFYRLPEQATFRRWAERAPARFLFAVKASRCLTHMKKLKDRRGRSSTGTGWSTFCRSYLRASWIEVHE